MNTEVARLRKTTTALLPPLSAIILLTASLVGGLWWCLRREAHLSSVSPVTSTVAQAIAYDLGSAASEDGGNHDAVSSQLRRSVPSRDRAAGRKTSTTTTTKGVIGGDADLLELARQLTAISTYRLGQKSSVNALYLVPKDDTKPSYLVPLSSLGTINGAGTLWAKKGSNFLTWDEDGTSEEVGAVPGFLMLSTTESKKEVLMSVIHRLKAKSGTRPIP